MQACEQEVSVVSLSSLMCELKQAEVAGPEW